MRRATLALLFIACAIASSFLTYMVVSGYWYELGIQVPGLPSIAITKVRFPLENTSYFELTVLNPSFSLSAVRLENVCVITPEDEVHVIKNVSPSLPRELGAGKSVKLKCMWDWGNYTGEELRITVFIEEGSGASFLARPPAVKLVLSASFNASRPFWFLLNVTNSPESPTTVNLTAVEVVLANGTRTGVRTEPEVSPDKPYGLEPNSTVTLNCTWNWLRYRNETLTIVVRTLQGYRAYLGLRTPPPVVLKITEVEFVRNGGTCYFNITVLNDPSSPAPARLCDISVVVNNTLFGPEDLNVTPPLSPPVLIRPGESKTFMCNWNWTPYEGYRMNITVSSVLGYTANATVTVVAGVQKPASGQVARGPRCRLSSPSRLCSSPSSRGPRLCVLPARTRRSALCGLSHARRSIRPVWPRRRPLL